MSRVLRTFRQMIGLLSRGDFDRKLNEEMAKCICALEDMPADKGTATMTVTIKLNYELGRIDIDPTVKTKLPETAKFMKTPFWALDGELSLEHPNQINMFAEPKVVGTSDGEADDAEAETA